MDYFRAGGVCLLIMLIAAALPIGGLAATQTGAANSGFNSVNPSASGATPVVNANSFSNGIGAQEFGQAAAPIKVQRPSSGIRPGAVTGSYVPVAAATTETTTNSETSNTVPQGQSTPTSPSTQAVTTTAANAEQSTATPAPATTPETLKTSTITSAPTEPTPSSNPTANNNVALPSSNVAAVGNETPTIASVNSTVTNPTIVDENKSTASISTSNNTTPSVTEVSENKTVQNITPAELSPAAAPAPALIDRIWRQGISPLDYTWTPLVFSGFFYDLDDKVGTENLTVHLTSETSRSIAEHNLKYETNVQPIDFKFKDWGKYQVIGFMADKYFAGYSGTNILDKDISLINEGQLRQVLIDNDDEKTIVQGSVMPLEEGYELRIKQIDVNGNKVYLALAKDGKEIDSKVVSPGTLKSSTYQYKVTISGEDTPIIMAHIPSVFAGSESGIVTVDGLFQVSDTYKSVEDGDTYGKMKVVGVSDTGVTMDNTDSVSLGKGKTVNIFGNVSFQIADADVLRFAPFVEHTGPYEIRGTIVDPSLTKQFTWTPYNFEGFYYDIDDDTGTENLTAKISGSSIADGDLTYSTSPSPVKFQFEDWGKYDVIGFMADKYFSGYNNATQFADQFSDINDGELRKILVDSKDEQTITTGSVLPLEEGYELRIKQVDINGNKVYLALAKDGKEIDSKVVAPSSGEFKTSNYLYKITMGSKKDVPMIAAHVQSVFKGTEADLATIDGLFQLSDSPANVEEGEMQGKMKVETLTDTGITMKNDGSISLGRGRTVDIMGNLKFVVADNDDRNFAPVAERSGATKALDLNITEPVVVNSTMNMQVMSAGEAISGVSISVNGDVIGNTDASGSISYVPKSVGSIEVVASKVPYAENRTTVVVRTSAAAAAISANSANVTNTLALSVPSDALKNQTFLITVTGGANQTAIENASISFDNTGIGNTSAQGTLKYASSVLGEHTITAQAAGYDKVSRNITVMTPIQVQTFNVSSTSAKTGQTITVKANVQNVGAFNDTRNLELIVNGNKTVDSQNVTLGPGENKTLSFSYKPNDAGTYRLSLDGKMTPVTVEKSTTNWALIAIILVLLIAIGAGAYLYHTGELETLRKRLQKRQ
ncbi:MAG: S-layer protein domain-containing protein [Methanotrichaceae archaeon]